MRIGYYAVFGFACARVRIEGMNYALPTSQNAPLNIAVEFFACDGTLGKPLDSRTMVGRNLPLLCPLIDCLNGYAAALRGDSAGRN